MPGGPRNTTFSRAVTKSRVPRCAIRSRLRPRAWSKSNSSRLLRAGNRAARMRPSPPWDSRAATSRCRQATRNSSCDQDSARARSASRATDSRSVGAFSARVRNATSAVRSRAAVLVAARVVGPSRHPAIEAEGGVVVGQPTLLDLWLGDRAQHPDPFAAQRASRRRRARGRRWSDARPRPARGRRPAGRRKGHRTRCRSAMTSIRRPITAGCTE